MKAFIFPTTLGLLLTFPLLAALAGPITITGDTVNSSDHLGNFEATFTYSAANATSATLTIALTNTTSPSGTGGYITGLAFNNPVNPVNGIGYAITDVNSYSSLPNTHFTLLLGAPNFNDNTINAAPLGSFDIGATLKTSWMGSGNPSGGIPIGSSSTFTFGFTGNGLNLLDENSFVSTLSDPTGDHNGYFFAVRFRGMVEEGSDKVPGLVDPGDPVRPNPEPSTLVLAGLTLGMGLVVPAARRYRRRPTATA